MSEGIKGGAERRDGYKAGSNGLAATNPAPPDL